jgi:two-component system, OmpR family, alkaline phosphatase synthesis response regulator PhoP
LCDVFSSPLLHILLTLFPNRSAKLVADKAIPYTYREWGAPMGDTIRAYEEGSRAAMPQTILVVDDKANIRILLQEYLVEQGYRVVTATNGREALYAARSEKPGLILLDIMMPEMDGYDFIRAYRQERATPIILLTARLEETDKVVGLELGADDYVTKPFGMRELLARVRAVLRRANADPVAGKRLEVDGLVVDEERRLVTVEGRPVTLTPSEFSLLATLMRTPGRVFSRLELLDTLPGEAFAGAERSVDVHIRNLRKKIEPDAANPHYVETVFGVGYRLHVEGTA